jgi:mono/diheme cytochrome c family protein
MSRPNSASHESLVFPMVFLVSLFVGLTILFQPQHVDVSTLPKVSTATPAPVALQPTPTIDTSNLDHLMLMAMGLEEVNASSVQQGGRIYTTTCTACHGYDAKGINGLGKPLIDSEFVNQLKDDALVSFIVTGRTPDDPLNTTGQQMPARGGNPGLTDEDLNAVVDYIRSLNGATVINDLEQQVASTSGEFTPINVNAIDASAVQPSGGASGSAELTDLMAVEFTPPDINAIDPSIIRPSHSAEGELDFATMTGQQAFNWSCAGCHGLDGTGTAALMPDDLTQISVDDADILAEFTQPGDILAGFNHAFRGGYPALTDGQLRAVLEHVRILINQKLE